MADPRLQPHTTRDIRLIALDLDGTLLNSQKELPPENRAALLRAAQAGIHIVPTTGRSYEVMPDSVRDLRYVRYVIAMNGAQVLDAGTKKVLYRAEIRYTDAVRIMEYLDAFDLIYDCFMDDHIWMTRSMWERCAEYAMNEHQLMLLKNLRRPVDDLKSFVRDHGGSVQKIQAVFRDMSLRGAQLTALPERFPEFLHTSSVPNNIEINHAEANKGRALEALCRHLGIGPEQCIAFGDGLNDVSMLRTAGIGVAMKESCPEAFTAADMTAASCDENGVARMLESLRIP